MQKSSISAHVLDHHRILHQGHLSHTIRSTHSWRTGISARRQTSRNAIRISTIKYTCTLDRCKQRKKERKEEEKKTKGTRVFSAIHNDVVAMRKKNLETIFGGEGMKKRKKKKKKEKWEIHSCFIRIGYYRYTDTRSLEDARRSKHRATHSMTFTVDLQKTITISINPSSFLLFNALPRRRCLRNATQHPSYIAHIRIHSLVHKSTNHPSFFEQEFKKRQYDTTPTDHRSLFWALLDCLRSI